MPSESEQRLARIGDLLQAELEETGAFPAGARGAVDLPVEKRWSWLASLSDRLDSRVSAPVLWDRAWQDPLNEAFVRRRIAEFQNPAIERLTGIDGYPAAHFAGVAGVGRDAAQLETSDPRAGIFGEDRRTRLEDIRDGTSNTLLVLGVNDQLGSWASGGAATVRGLTREPYINGPDGFGTGQTESMFVLMADGSVRTVSQKTDPRLIRRMAAMADGLPLDTQVPGEPGDPSSAPEARMPITSLSGSPGMAASPLPVPAVPAPGQPASATPAKQPALPTQAEPAPSAGSRPANSALPDTAPAQPTPPADNPPVAVPEPAAPALTVEQIDARLNQKLLKFEQQESVPLSAILDDVSLMAGVSIVVADDLPATLVSRLEKGVRLKLEQPTLRDLLERSLQPVGLSFVVEKGIIRVVAPATAQSEK